MTCEADFADCPDGMQLLAGALAALLTLARVLVCSEDAGWMPMRPAGGQDGNQMSAVVESRVFALGRQSGRRDCLSVLEPLDLGVVQLDFGKMRDRDPRWQDARYQ